MTAPFDEQFASEGTDGAKTWVGVFLLVGFIVRLSFVFIAPNNGVDALSRYRYALLWIRNPLHLPQPSADAAWLPLHFWLLGAILALHNSELSARLFTAVVGTLTILPYWAILRRAFGRRVALASTLVFGLFGFHVAYSVTTSSEAPTAFLLALGIYFWIRFLLEGKWKWGIAAGIALSLSSLCRFEPWISIPILSVLLLDFSRGWASVWSNRRAWLRMTCFALVASAGAVGWMIYSYARWGDALELPHRTIRDIQSLSPALRHPLPYRMLVVPASLAISLSPLIIALAVVGMLRVLCQAKLAARSIAVLSLTLFGFNYFNAMVHGTTQARYTLVYSWLFIPFAFEGLRWTANTWAWTNGPKGYASVIGFFLFWQSGIIAGAHYAPTMIADGLSSVSPTLPLRVENRGLTEWLRQHTNGTDAVVFDEFNYESDTLIRFSDLDSSQVYQVRHLAYSDSKILSKELQAFIRLHHPHLAVCSPDGPIGAEWALDDNENLEVSVAGIRLHLEWRGSHWRVYSIEYP
jgi:hypothetical protein